MGYLLTHRQKLQAIPLIPGALAQIRTRIGNTTTALPVTEESLPLRTNNSEQLIIFVKQTPILADHIPEDRILILVFIATSPNILVFIRNRHLPITEVSFVLLFATVFQNLILGTILTIVDKA